MDIEPLLVLLRPLYLIVLSAWFIPHTIWNLITTLNFKPLTSLSLFKDHWFARFWIYFGPLSRENAASQVLPLLSHASGVVLEVGPGQGHFLRLYAQLPNKSRITKIYAVEPNEGHHQALRANAKQAGLEDVFEIIDSTIETLESKAGIKRHSIDTIVTLQVLCSINDPETLVRELRTYLKPDGGKWIAYEHVRRRDNGGVAFYQDKLNLIWPTFFNGCNLNRDTDIAIKTSGKWDLEKSSTGGLKQAENDSAWTALPTVMGVLVSKE